jgi:hypothetical protein
MIYQRPGSGPGLLCGLLTPTPSAWAWAPRVTGEGGKMAEALFQRAGVPVASRVQAGRKQVVVY